MKRGIKTIFIGNRIRFETQKSSNFHFTYLYRSKMKGRFFFTFYFENDEHKENIKKVIETF